MISEGRSGTDNVYSLKDGLSFHFPCILLRALHLSDQVPVVTGILRLELDKATYERAGLVGKTIHGGGRKHVKERFGSVMTIPLAHPTPPPLCICISDGAILLT